MLIYRTISQSALRYENVLDPSEWSAFMRLVRVRVTPRAHSFLVFAVSKTIDEEIGTVWYRAEFRPGSRPHSPFFATLDTLLDYLIALEALEA